VPDTDCIERHMPEASEVDRAKLIEWAEWFAGTELGATLKDRKSVRKEMPFFTRIAGLPVRGVIDLYESQLPLLLDYKTGGRVRAEEYGVQVAVYLAAVRALGGRSPDRAHLVYVDAREIVEVEEQSIDALIERFRDAHSGAMQFPPEPGPACEHCDFRRACEAQGVALP
jgi:CRISPR/Cas system-associated exonuclease Cas4 (RecB family)